MHIILILIPIGGIEIHNGDITSLRFKMYEGFLKIPTCNKHAKGLLIQQTTADTIENYTTLRSINHIAKARYVHLKFQFFVIGIDKLSFYMQSLHVL